MDTSSQALTWSMAAVATHPEVQHKLEEELKEVGLLATPQHPEPRVRGREGGSQGGLQARIHLWGF